MRNGVNPAKIDPQLSAFKRHRVVLPVYVPARDGYFRDALEILRLCLDSLRYTAGPNVSVTVVANQCIPEILDELQRRLSDGQLDQLIVNAGNRGKVDSVTAAARASFEPLITVADGDVMFLPGWANAVEDLFMHFPECGFLSLFPNPITSQSWTSATILGGLTAGELAYEKVVPDEDLDQFARSIGRPDWFKPEARRTQMIVRRRGVPACVGAGHFVFTIRKDIVDAIPKSPALQAVGGGRPSGTAPDGKRYGEYLWLDKPPDDAGVWKLSTPRAFAYHLGNTPEPWMYDELERCRTAPAFPSRELTLPPIRRRWISRVPFAMRTRTAYRIQNLHQRLTTGDATPTESCAPSRGVAVAAAEDLSPSRADHGSR
jgi:hypothetical protein